MFNDFNASLGSRLRGVLYDCVHDVDGMDGGIIFIIYLVLCSRLFWLGTRLSSRWGFPLILHGQQSIHQESSVKNNIF